MSELSEDPGERAQRYITALENVLQGLRLANSGDVVVSSSKVAVVLDMIERYFDDARFYLNSGKQTTSLASIAYAEGLLDALNYLELTKTVRLN